jgi:hypothetical protein
MLPLVHESTSLTVLLARVDNANAKSAKLLLQLALQLLQPTLHQLFPNNNVNADNALLKRNVSAWP